MADRRSPYDYDYEGHNRNLDAWKDVLTGGPVRRAYGKVKDVSLKDWYINLLRNGEPSEVDNPQATVDRLNAYSRGPMVDELRLPEMGLPPAGADLPPQEADDSLERLLAASGGARRHSSEASPISRFASQGGSTPSSPQQLSGVTSKGDLKSDRYQDLKDMISKLEKKKSGLADVNLKPLLALTDAWTGSRLASSYDAPESAEERQFKIAALKQGLTEKEALDAYRQAKVAADLQQQQMVSEDKKASRDLQEKIARIYAGARVESAKERGGDRKEKEPDLGKLGQQLYTPAKPALRQIFATHQDIMPEGTDIEAALPTIHSEVVKEAKKKYKAGSYDDFREAYADQLKAFMQPPPGASE